MTDTLDPPIGTRERTVTPVLLRHERLSTVATLQGRQTQARSGGEARDALFGQVPGAPLSQGGRPAPLPEVAGWQERIQRHTGEQTNDDLPYVQILDAPVPQMVDNALEFFRRLGPCRLLSRLSKCPIYPRLCVLLGRFSVSRRLWNS